MNNSTLQDDPKRENMKMKTKKTKKNKSKTNPIDPMKNTEVGQNEADGVSINETSPKNISMKDQPTHLSETENKHLSIGRIGRILEFDRSDLSSDSEPERSRHRRMSFGSRKVNKTRRARFSLDERTRKITDSENYKNDDPATHRSRRRRSGVSAEPVRELWNAMEGREPEGTQQRMDDEENGKSTKSLYKHFTPESLPQIVILDSNMKKETGNEGQQHGYKNNDKSGEESGNDNGDEKEKEKSVTSGCTDDTTLEEKIVTDQLDYLFSTKLRTDSGSGSDTCSQYSTQSWSRLEKRYKTLIISFQTDKYTLDRRLESQERARDVAESNIEKELQKFNSLIKSLETSQLSTLPGCQDVLTTLSLQVDVVRKAAMKVSAQAEQHGCYQQEKLTAPKIEVMIAYVENLRKHADKLEDEMKRAKSSDVEEGSHHPMNGLAKRTSVTSAISPVIHTPDTSPKEKKRGDVVRRITPSYIEFSSEVCQEKFQENIQRENEKNKKKRSVNFCNDICTDNIYSLRDPVKGSQALRKNKFYFLIVFFTSVIIFIIGSYVELNTQRKTTKSM